MKDYTFKVPQDIVFGVGSLKRLPELLEKSGSKKMNGSIRQRAGEIRSRTESAGYCGDRRYRNSKFS